MQIDTLSILHNKLLFYNRQNHLEFCKRLQRMWNIFLHYNYLAGFQNVRNSEDFDFSFSLFVLNQIFQNKRSCIFNIFNKFFFYFIASKSTEEFLFDS